MYEILQAAGTTPAAFFVPLVRLGQRFGLALSTALSTQVAHKLYENEQIQRLALR